MYTPVNPSFTLSGVQGGQNYIGVFSWCFSSNVVPVLLQNVTIPHLVCKMSRNTACPQIIIMRLAKTQISLIIRVKGTLWVHVANITKTRLFKYIENFTSKNWKFSDKKKSVSYFCSKHNNNRCSLEPHQGGGSNECPQSMFSSKNKKK